MNGSFALKASWHVAMVTIPSSHAESLWGCGLSTNSREGGGVREGGGGAVMRMGVVSYQKKQPQLVVALAAHSGVALAQATRANMSNKRQNADYSNYTSRVVFRVKITTNSSYPKCSGWDTSN